MSAKVYAWSLPEATSTTVILEIVLPVSSLPLMIRSTTNQKYVFMRASISVVSIPGC